MTARPDCAEADEASRAEGERWVGRRLRRLHDRRLLIGRGSYTADLRLGPALEVAFVRSPHAHARLLGVSTERARRSPGVVAVLSGADLRPHARSIWGGVRMKVGEKYPLAVGKVRHVGEAVAMVLAENRYVAEDACDLVDVDYGPLPAVVDPERALAEGAPLLYEEFGDNMMSEVTFESGSTADAMAGCPVVVEARFRSNRHLPAFMEPRGCLCRYDPGTGEFTLHASAQDPYLLQTLLAGLLDMPMHLVRVVAPDVGGGFGGKLQLYAEEAACAVAAKMLGRTVRWISDRREDFLTTIHARDAIVYARLGVAEDGRMKALHCDVVSDCGAWSAGARGNNVEGQMAARDMTGPYKIEQYSFTVRCVFTNKPPLGHYRGVGIPISYLVIEGLIDRAARRLGLDPIEMRRRNLIRREDFPYTTLTGHVIEPGSYLESLERCCELIGYDAFRQEQRHLLGEGRYVGIGFTVQTHATGFNSPFYSKDGVPVVGQDACYLKMHPDGTVTASMGATSQGQGWDTAGTQVIADELGILPEDVRIDMGDTARTPHGGGAWASRTAVVGGAVAVLAARELREKILRIAAHMLEADAEDLELRDRGVRVRGADFRAVSIREVARAAYLTPGHLPPGMDPGLVVARHWEPPMFTFANMTVGAVVEVDPETGVVALRRLVAVNDSGTVINPLIVEGQVHGGLAQGIGGSLYEHLVYDEETGQALVTSFMDYLVPTAMEVPTIEVDLIETPSPHIPGGFKGVGELGTSAVPGAVANAVSDALHPLGVEVADLPLSPTAVYGQLSRAGAYRESTR